MPREAHEGALAPKGLRAQPAVAAPVDGELRSASAASSRTRWASTRRCRIRSTTGSGPGSRRRAGSGSAQFGRVRIRKRATVLGPGSMLKSNMAAQAADEPDAHGLRQRAGTAIRVRSRARTTSGRQLEERLLDARGAVHCDERAPAAAHDAARERASSWLMLAEPAAARRPAGRSCQRSANCAGRHPVATRASAASSEHARHFCPQRRSQNACCCETRGPRRREPVLGDHAVATSPKILESSSPAGASKAVTCRQSERQPSRWPVPPELARIGQAELLR